MQTFPPSGALERAWKGDSGRAFYRRRESAGRGGRPQCALHHDDVSHRRLRSEGSAKIRRVAVSLGSIIQG